MKVINSKAHGVLDYLAGILLISSPWLFNFYMASTETWIPVSVGVAVIIYSLFTDYEFSLVKGISMVGHLTLDMIAGIFLAASPWIFGFNEMVYTPHLWLGIGLIAFVLLSNQVAYSKEVKVGVTRPTSGQPSMNQPQANKSEEEEKRTGQRM